MPSFVTMLTALWMVLALVIFPGAAAKRPQKVRVDTSAKAFFQAIDQGNTPRLQQQLRLKPQLVHQKQDETGVTPLYYAVVGKHSRAALVLLSWGADPQTDYEGVPLIHLVARDGDPALMAGFLDKGAALEQLDYVEFTPLMTAVWAGNLPMIRYLLDRGARADATDMAGKTVYDYAREKGLPEDLLERLRPAESKIP